jgi:hypothetical protein
VKFTVRDAAISHTRSNQAGATGRSLTRQCTLRFNMLNLYTREHHVQRLAELLAAAARRAATEAL